MGKGTAKGSKGKMMQQTQFDDAKKFPPLARVTKSGQGPDGARSGRGFAVRHQKGVPPRAADPLKLWFLR